MGSISEHIFDVQGPLLNTPRSHVLNGLFRLSQALRRARDTAVSMRPRIPLLGTRISVIMLNGDHAQIHRSVNSLLRQTWHAWDARLPIVASEGTIADARIRYARTGEVHSDAEFLNAAQAAARGEIVGFLQPGDELSPDALAQAADYFNRHPGTDVLYGDEMRLDHSGQITSHFFKPDWSPQLLLAINYIRGLVFVRRETLAHAGAFNAGGEGAHLYDLALRATEQARDVGHLARPIHHRRDDPPHLPWEAGANVLQSALKRRDVDAVVVPATDGRSGSGYRIRYELKQQPLVTIIIPTRNHGEVLRRCIESIEARTTYAPYEILVVDHESSEPETRGYLASLRHRVMPYRGSFNYSRINNTAAAEARGNVLVFLNNDTRVISPDWIDAMLEHVQQPGTGLVGAKLLYPDNIVQHAGTIVGYQGSAANYSGLPHDAPGYHGLACVARECSAVTGACMMIRKEVFDALGGFDEGMDQAWQDVDLCLRARRQGYGVMFTPYALLHHDEGKTRGRFDDSPGERASKRLFQRIHRQALKRGDPFYNRNFSAQYGFYEFDPATRKDVAIDSPTLVAHFLRGCHEKDSHDMRWLPRRSTLLVITRSDRAQTMGFTLTADRESHYRRTPLLVKLHINGVLAETFSIQSPADLHAVRIRLPPGQLAHTIDIQCSESFVPAVLGLNADRRQLSVMLTQLAVDADLLQETSSHRLRHIRGFYHAEEWKWAGPHVEFEVLAQTNEPHLLRATITCHAGEAYDPFPFRVAVLADHREVARICFASSNQTAVLDVRINGSRSPTHLQLVAESSFIPSRVYHTADDRQLSYIINRLELLPVAAASRAVEPEAVPSAV